MTNKYYVYVYSDPTKNNEHFYVGKGCGNRKDKHLRETKENTENMRKYLRIREIIAGGQTPIVTIIYDNLPEDVAYDIEAAIIKYYGRIKYDDGGILTNISIDNRPAGMGGKSHTEETKKIIQGKMKTWILENGNPMQGRKHSEKSKKLMREKALALGTTITEDGRRRIGEASAKRNKGADNPIFGKKRKAMYNPLTMDCKYVDITDNMDEVEVLVVDGWQFGLIRPTWKPSNGMTGKKHSPKAKKSISDSSRGHAVSKTTRQKIGKAAAIRNSAAGNPMFGKKRKAIYNPLTMECKYIDITHTTDIMDDYLSAGWLLGRKPKIKN